MIKKKIFAMYFLAIVILLVSCQKRGAVYDESLPDDMNPYSGIALSEFSASYVEKYWNNRKFHLGKIRMELDDDLKGMVYAEFADSMNGAPSVVEIAIDTIGMKVVQLSELGKGSKIDPGMIHIENWKVDSQEAILLAKEEITKKYHISRIDSIHVDTNNASISKRDSWSIVVSSNAGRYFAYIDVLSKDITVGKVTEYNQNDD
ncbi:hypothetical protein [Cohnella sp. GCM10012308]|uniref:hypothetical protein n=1 Tax=Cohnella sp. GCM10012308 TaxID=3317329 RepID=UPI00361C1D48